MNYKVLHIFHVPGSVQEAGAEAHSHTFYSACFVGFSIVEETCLWVLLYYSDAMVSDPWDLNDRSKEDDLSKT